MSAIQIMPLQDDLTFGARISGVTEEALHDDGIRDQLNRVFEDRGLLIFEQVEQSPKMQVALSEVFGPLKDHPVPSVKRVDQDAMPGVIDMRYNPETGSIVEIEGKQLASWLPWHFDHCYNNELNRAGVLRAVEVPAEGGRTGFADGIELYRALPPALVEKIASSKVIYTLDLHYSHMRFGVPTEFKEVQINPEVYATLEFAKTLPRAIHPAVWTRDSGEKVLHVSPWMAVGIEGHEDDEGNALLQTLCEEIYARLTPYFHQWQASEMLIWDNWRLLHSVSGHNPGEPRRMQRTTIKGEYGLGYFEHNGKGDKLLEMTV
jgi:taurine dioxygenase